MISEAAIEKTLHYLLKITESSIEIQDASGHTRRVSELGLAVEEARRAEHMRKHIWALRAEKEEGALGKKEIAAYASPEYRQAIEDVAHAMSRLEVLHARVEWAKLRIEVWRTQNANRRGPNL